MNNKPSALLTHVLGYPRIGRDRELKKAVEATWQGKLDLAGLRAVGAQLRREHWSKLRAKGIDLIPSNDFSFYDQVLDHSQLLGNLPKRFAGAAGDPLETLFQVARGGGGCADQTCGCGTGARAGEMTKWFDTNYHYIVPEFHHDTSFRVTGTKPFDEFAEALALGITTKPVLIGPVTYLLLGKVMDEGLDRLALLPRLLPAYAEIVRRLSALGARWIQLDEPYLATDLPEGAAEAYREAYAVLRRAAGPTKLLLTPYFGELRENLGLALRLPVDALHLDLTRGPNDLPEALRQYPDDKILSLGLVDGRNVWRNDYTASLRLIRQALRSLPAERLWVGTSCSLLHAPYDAGREARLPEDIRSWLAFAEEKVGEVAWLGRNALGDAALETEENLLIAQSRRTSPLTRRSEVRERLRHLKRADFTRHNPYSVRREAQARKLGLPLLPTTTIGSFPQTAAVRKARADFKAGRTDQATYDAFLRERTRECVALQENLGLDVLAHGEFERTDMVEFFGEKLDGFALTGFGWVQSYGTRCVKPPIIFGDIRRPAPMTTEWAAFAQSLTKRPMKGMLTGPITILQWSFVRDDQPRSQTAFQLALAIRDEVADLEALGLSVIQIDEPALREGLPLRTDQREDYLDWATQAFRLASSCVADATQIHTHMCYCEFADVIDAIASLDADVISIETTRSDMSLLRAFTQHRYPNEIGPGVWDIHSPRVPSEDEIARLLRLALRVLPAERVWANPDCGLKTRGWDETIASLRNLVGAARKVRGEITGRHGPT